MTTTDTRTIGAIQDLTVATEFLMTALREIASGAKPKDEEVQRWVNMAMLKLAPLVGGAAPEERIGRAA